MAETTTAQSACGIEVWLDDDAGVQKDLSGSSSRLSMDFENMLGGYRVFTTEWMKRMECGKDATWTINAVYSTGGDEAVDLLNNWFFSDPPGDRTMTVYIPNKNVGSDTYQGEFKIESFNYTADPSDPGPIAVTFVVRPSGEVTHSTSAT
jgi:hypothetical protein